MSIRRARIWIIEPTFVDTSVLIYVRDATNNAKHNRAVSILKRLWRDRAGRISVQVLNEYYVTLSRNLQVLVPRDDAWDDVLDLMSWNPQPIDQEILSRAREIERRYVLSWAESLIVAAAQAQRCMTLLSEGFQEGMTFDGLTVRNPFTLGFQDTAVAYSADVLPKPRPRHRARGRPVSRTDGERDD